MCTAAPPDVGGEFLAFLLWCLVDDLPAGVVPASLVLEYGLSVLRQGSRAGVVLPGALSFSRTRHGEPESGIAGLTKPAEIVGRTVRFVAVGVIYHKKRVEPHKAHLRGEGGQHSGVWAR